jgi:hypothetical protein
MGTKNEFNWQCPKCDKYFKSNIKFYNPCENLIIMKILKKALLLKIKAKPQFMNCCKIDINNTPFFHKKECKGLLYLCNVENYFLKNKKWAIVCEKCQAINNCKNFIWTCPKCGKRSRETNDDYDNINNSYKKESGIIYEYVNEFKKGYRAYKQGKLNGRDFPGDTSGWYTLDPNSTIKFNINGDDYPLFIAAIPTLIDLDIARDLDQKRMAQKLLRIIIQKMPLDKNGDSIFDIDEAKELHNNAVKMLKKSIGTDVLTTFADVDVADMSDKSNTTQSDDVNRVKMSVFDEFGTSVDNFNSTSNAALKYSDLNDASNMYNLLQQFEGFLNRLLKPYNTNSKRVYYTAQILETTNSNYQDMAKLYREQTQLGFSKMLPQIALGQSESSILATAYWENEILNLIEVFVPPISSATMNADTLQALTGKSADNNAAAAGQSSGSSQIQSDSKVGRPEKADEDKSDKTIANRESL